MDAPREMTYAAVFMDSLKQLKKKEPGIQNAALTLIEKIANTPNYLPGDRIPGLHNAPVYKVRLACGNQGTRGGYRVIYYCAEQMVRAMFIYRKSEQQDMAPGVIGHALRMCGLLE